MPWLYYALAGLLVVMLFIYYLWPKEITETTIVVSDESDAPIDPEPEQKLFVGKLSDDEVRTIRSMDNPDIVLLASKYNVSVTTIRNVLARRTYKNVI